MYSICSGSFETPLLRFYRYKLKIWSHKQGYDTLPKVEVVSRWPQGMFSYVTMVFDLHCLIEHCLIYQCLKMESQRHLNFFFSETSEYLIIFIFFPICLYASRCLALWVFVLSLVTFSLFSSVNAILATGFKILIECWSRGPEKRYTWFILVNWHQSVLLYNGQCYCSAKWTGVTNCPF